MKALATAENTPPLWLCNKSSGLTILAANTFGNPSIEFLLYLEEKGQMLKHFPQLMHLASSITGYTKPSSSGFIVIAWVGQTLEQAVHPEHSVFCFMSTLNLFIIGFWIIYSLL